MWLAKTAIQLYLYLYLHLVVLRRGIIKDLFETENKAIRYGMIFFVFFIS